METASRRFHGRVAFFCSAFSALDKCERVSHGAREERRENTPTRQLCLFVFGLLSAMSLHASLPPRLLLRRAKSMTSETAAPATRPTSGRRGVGMGVEVGRVGLRG